MRTTGKNLLPRLDVSATIFAPTCGRTVDVWEPGLHTESQADNNQFLIKIIQPRPKTQISWKAKLKRRVVDLQLREQYPADYPIRGLSER